MNLIELLQSGKVTSSFGFVKFLQEQKLHEINQKNQQKYLDQQLREKRAINDKVLGNTGKWATLARMKYDENKLDKSKERTSDKRAVIFDSTLEDNTSIEIKN